MKSNPCAAFGCILAASLALSLAPAAQSQVAAPPNESAKLVNLSELQWDEPPKGLPAGAKIVVLRGDPGKGSNLTLLLKLPKGYKLPPHWRAQGGQVTVVSGTVYLGVGETTDLEKAKLLQTGGYAYLPATTHHYIVAREPAVVQLQTLGPLDLNYLNPAEDPRNK